MKGIIMSNDHWLNIRHDHPGRARAADHENSRQNAIELKCLDCCNGQREVVRNCGIMLCSLWPYRPFATADQRARPTASVPTTEEYNAMIGVRGNSDALREWRSAQTLAEETPQSIDTTT
jgi:hypothetical protein